jgi:hypothetical protein
LRAGHDLERLQVALGGHDQQNHGGARGRDDANHAARRQARRGGAGRQCRDDDRRFATEALEQERHAERAE